MTTDELTDYDAIAEAAWTRLAQAANDPTQTLRLMTVATVSPQGRPSTRTLVLRGADRPSGLVWFHTDRRSPKIHHLEHQPWISALGYDERDHLQIRLDGEVTLHYDDVLANRHWEQVSMAVRYAYGLSHGPGERLQQPDPRSQVMRRQQSLGQAGRGHENFVVIQMQVESIDWLQIGSMGQVRALLRAATNWKSEPLVP